VPFCTTCTLVLTAFHGTWSFSIGVLCKQRCQTQLRLCKWRSMSFNPCPRRHVCIDLPVPSFFYLHPVSVSLPISLRPVFFSLRVVLRRVFVFLRSYDRKYTKRGGSVRIDSFLWRVVIPWSVGAPIPRPALPPIWSFLHWLHLISDVWWTTNIVASAVVESYIVG
jgi:hypothetical protein